MGAYDICIIGFGPTGAVAASLLAEAGHSVVVVDRLTEVYDKPRAIALDHEIMRLFQNMGVLESILPHVAVYPPSEFRGVEGDIIRRLDAAPPPFPQGWAPNYSFTQPPVEAILRDRAVCAGVTLHLGYELLSLDTDGDRIGVTAQGLDGSTISLDAQYVIGADGANSTVRRLTGLELEDLDFDEPWLVIDVEVDDQALLTLPSVNVQYCEPARPATYVVGPGHHRRWEIMLDEAEDPIAAMQPARVWELLARWVTPANATLWRSATYRFHALVARKWQSGRIFIAGDAAHQQPPFLGQGMCQGLRDAMNLAWKLDHVLRGRASEALLATYGEERCEHVSQLISVIKTLGRFVCERDIERARRRDEALLAAMNGKLVTTIRQDIMPKLEVGLLSAHERDGRGTLFPQPRLADGSLLDEVLGLGFRLIVAGDAPSLQLDMPCSSPWLSAARIVAASTAAGQNDDFAVFHEVDEVVTGWFRARGAIAALVRPDNYVFGVAQSVDEVLDLIEECCQALR